MSKHIRALKTDKEYAIPIALAQALMIKNQQVGFDSIDMIVSIPIHADKRRTRGFDQAEEIGTNLARLLSKQFSNILVKTQNISLHEITSLPDKIEKVKGLYSCDRTLHGERLLIVDDTATTGLDLGECAKILRQSGASLVRGFVGGRTVFRVNDSPPETGSPVGS